MFYRLLVVLLLFSTILSACGSSAGPSEAVSAEAQAAAGQSVTVFAAASLAEAFGELGKQFEAQNPGAKLVFNFGGSQQLAEQLAQGAPADVFVSANQAQMDAAVKAGRVAEGDPQPSFGEQVGGDYRQA